MFINSGIMLLMLDIFQILLFVISAVITVVFVVRKHPNRISSIIVTAGLAVSLLIRIIFHFL